MTTATNLGVRAAARFKDPSNNVVTAAQWLSYCNEAYSDVNAFSPLWPWLETSEQTISFTAGNREASLPTDVVGVNWAYDTTDDYRLIDQMGRGDFFHQDHLRSETGQPVTYRVYGAKMQLNPTPSVNTTVVAECIMQPVDLAGGDSPVFPSSFHNILIDDMLAAAYLDDGNPNLAEAHAKRFNDGLERMRNAILLGRTETNQPIRDTFWS
jgi:hypothetical protein